MSIPSGVGGLRSGSVIAPEVLSRAPRRSMSPLSTDAKEEKGAIDALTAPGNATSSGAGIEWGRRMPASSRTGR